MCWFWVKTQELEDAGHDDDDSIDVHYSDSGKASSDMCMIEIILACGFDRCS
jgi:hypothetical protein